MSNYPNTPFTLASNPGLNKYQYGTQGLATGNPIVDPVLTMMMGQNMAPRPNPVANSMLQAAIMRRRSLDFMNIDRFGLTNNSFTNSFGGVAPNSALAMAMWAGNNMTGGTQNGLISRGLSGVLGGNPMLAQQKLYAGLNGLTTQAAFGMRGETSLGTTNRMMEALSAQFHNAPTRMSATELAKTGSDIRSKFDKLGLNDDVKKGLEKALTDALKGQAVTGAIDKLTAGLGDSVAKEIVAGINKASYAAKNGRFGGINFNNSFGLSMEDFTGGFTTAASQGLFTAKRGTSLESAMGDFIKNGGGGVMNASRVMFGGESGAEYMQNLNQFLGVSRVNFSDKNDISAVTKALFKMQATAVNAGLDPAVMGHLVEQYKGLAQQGPMGMSIGGMEAAAGVTRSIERVQGLLVNGGPGMHNYLRRRGGTGGLINMTMQGEEALQSGAPSRFIYSMLGAAEAQGNTGMIEHIRNYIAKGDHSYSGFQDLQRAFSQSTGTPGGMMPELMRDEAYNAAGAAMASRDKSFDASRVSTGINMSTIEETVRQIARGDDGMVQDYWDALKTSTNVNNFRDTLENKWKARTGKFGMTGNLRSLLSAVEPMQAQVFGRYNPTVAATNAANEQFVNVTAGYSQALEGKFGELRASPAAQLMRMLVGGKMSQDGLKGVLSGFSGSIPSNTNMFTALQALSNGDELSFLQGVGKYAGANGLDSITKEALADFDKFSGRTIDDLRKKGDGAGVLAFFDQLGNSDATKGLKQTLFGADGKVSKVALMKFARAQAAKDMGMTSVKESAEYKAFMATNEAALSQFPIGMSPELEKAAASSGALKNGKWDVERLMDLSRSGKLDEGVWSGSAISSIAKNMASGIDSITNPDSATSNSADATAMLVEAITSEGGLISVIKSLGDAMNNLPST